MPRIDIWEEEWWPMLQAKRADDGNFEISAEDWNFILGVKEELEVAQDMLRNLINSGLKGQR